MAYTLHITRKKDWMDKEPKISQNEWNDLLANGTLELIDDENMKAWDAKKGNVYFSFYEGNIECNPRNEKDIMTIKEIALVLHAKVQGDDGEFY